LKKIVGIGTRLKMNSVQDPTINDDNAYLVTIIESKKKGPRKVQKIEHLDQG
jgi:hypothetical protein